ncbi:MAG: helix-turn-helix transcriptional regulator [Parafilimonas sp.]|nr:helix-turn-helix transcriptional regulator [Parafilimonas sp.]
MSSAGDKIFLDEFSKALKKNAKDGVINLDEKFVQQFNFFAQKYENIIRITGNIIPTNKWSYHRICIVTNGFANYTCGIYKFKAVKNTLFVLPANIPASSEWSDDGKGLAIVFNRDFFIQHKFSPAHFEDKTILQFTVPPCINVSDEKAGEVKKIFIEVLKEYESDNLHKYQLIALKVLELFIIIERLYEEKTALKNNGKNFDIIRKFTQLIEKNIRQHHGVTFYAAQLHIHPNHLNAIIKARTGLTAKECIQTRLLLEIKFLLHSTNMSIKEVANQLGFGNPYYLTVFFKRYQGISPAAYRHSFT